MIGWHHKRLCIRKRNHGRSYRKSEGGIVLFEGERQVRLRTAKVRNCFSRDAVLNMVNMAFKLCESAEKKWQKLHGYKRLADEIEENLSDVLKYRREIREKPGHLVFQLF